MVLTFADYELDIGRYELKQGGVSVPLESRVFEVLAYLIRQRDRVVSKDELLDAVWEGRDVSEATLERAISLLRGALGDRRRPHRMLGTVYGRGYRFLAPVDLRGRRGEVAEILVPSPEASPGRVGAPLCDERPALPLEHGTTLAASGQLARARERFLAAANLARRHRAPEALAAAALGYADATFLRAEGDPVARGMLEESLGWLPRSAVRLRAKLLSRLASVDTLVVPWAARESRTREALDLARRSGDEATLLSVLNAACVAFAVPDRIEEGLRLADEAVDLATRLDEPRDLLRAYRNRMTARLTLSDLAGYDRDLAAYAGIARAVGNPVHALFAEAGETARHSLVGCKPAVTKRVDELVAKIAEAGVDAAPAMVSLGPILREREMSEGALRITSTHVDRYPYVRAAFTALACDVGMLRTGREHFRTLAANAFREIPWDVRWLATMAFLSDACHALGDAARAEELYALMHPFESLNAVMGESEFHAPVSYYLGLLATTASRLDAAERHLRNAVARSSRMGIRACQVHAEIALARVLSLRGRRDDETEARVLMQSAGVAAEALGLSRAQARCESAEIATRT